MLYQFRNIFAKDVYDLGATSEVNHVIDTGDQKPIKQRPFRLPVFLPCIAGVAGDLIFEPNDPSK